MYWDERVDGGRCVMCNGVTVDAWVCVDCAIESEAYAITISASEGKWSNATKLGRALQRRVDSAGEHEQLLQLQTVMDHNVTPAEREGMRCKAPHRNGRQGEDGPKKKPVYEERSSLYRDPIQSEVARSAKIRSMRHHANDPMLGEHRSRLAETVPAKLGRFGEDARVKVRRSLRREKRRDAWVAAWKIWSDIGWAALDEMTRPMKEAA